MQSQTYKITHNIPTCATHDMSACTGQPQAVARLRALEPQVSVAHSGGTNHLCIGDIHASKSLALDFMISKTCMMP